MFTLTAGAALVLDPAGVLDRPSLQILAASLIATPTAAAILLAGRIIKRSRLASRRNHRAASLIDTVLKTSQEWMWSLDDRGYFTFSSPASTSLVGYTPEELIGKPCGLVIEPSDLARARRSVLTSKDPDSAYWNAVIVRCRHRDGSQVWVEATGRFRLPSDGQPGGFDGTSRKIPAQSAKEASAAHTRARIREMIRNKMLLTAFQPIHDIATGDVIGAEALTRFVSDNGAGPEFWFTEATDVGLASELEFAAIETALTAAHELPPCIYVAINISPATCLDPRLPGLLQNSAVPLGRLVLELTERIQVNDYIPLASALTPLRRLGLSVAVDDVGSGFSSMRHVLHIRPEIIKLDRSLVAGINDDEGQRALATAMVEFSKGIGATLVAEGIETGAELQAVASLGITAGQGYFLGRPSLHARDWVAWKQTGSSHP